MTIFWVIAGSLTALALAALCWPLVRRRSAAVGASTRETNVSIYRDQLAELARERESGALSETDYRDAHAELERRVLEDTREAAQLTVSADNRRAPKTAAILLLALPLVAVPLYLWLGTPAAFGPGAGHPAASHEAGGSMANLGQLAEKLAAKLESNPDNPEGWIMLGRTYRMLERYGEAEAAYRRAGPAANAEPRIMLERVELMANRAGGRIEGEALKLLNAVLAKEPGNPQANFLAGFAAFGAADYRNAIRYWEPLMQQVAPDSPDAQNLGAAIAEARTKLGETAPPPPSAGAMPNAAAQGAASIRGRLTLAPALAAKAKPDDPVFIFARAADGPPMPLAVVRARVADLPLEFALDDSQAMTPQAKLSQFKTVRLEARVAKSGDPIAKPGDLSGSIESVKVGAAGVMLTIDRIVP